MKTVSLILREASFRKLNFVLSALGVAAAVALFVFFFTSAEGSRRETARLMRDLGLNLRIIPRNTDMSRFYAIGFSEETMPVACVDRLAGQTGLSYSHLLATLQKKVSWRGREVILVGILPEKSAPDQRQPSMTFSVPRGSVYVGFELAQDLKIQKGTTVDLLGKTFTVASCLAETGTDDDIRIYGHLEDVQGLLGMEGLINEIKALNCLCLDPQKDSIEVLQGQLQRVLPEAKVIQLRSIAEAREKQRRMIEDYLAFLLPFVIAACVVWVGVLAMMNVREREGEIGILRAIGHGSTKIAGLFLGKAALVGVVGAVVGYGVGTALAMSWGPEMFKVTSKTITPLYGLLGWCLIGAVVLAGLSAFIPAMVAVTQDPAVTLRKE